MKKDMTGVTGDALDIERFNSSLNTLQSTSENLRERFEKQSIWSNIAGIVVTGIFGIAIAIGSLIILPFVLISNILIHILHIPTIVVSVINGLLILSIIFGIWRLIKAGD